ncbi:LuxR C-terminal-related transcriptional regulator, partial [Sulfobacillus harzensis]|nr:response regulator transcription factor [Sulfobacillus harzensis]
MSKPIRVVAVEDEDLFRELLITSLASFEEIAIIHAYRRGEDALARVVDDAPDVVLLDIDLGAGETGVQIGLRIRKILPHVGIVLLSNYDEPGLLTSLPPQEAAGWSYLLKKSVAEVSTIVRAIEGSHARLMVLDPFLVQALRPRPQGLVAGLTPRQREILALLAQGYSNAGIAQQLIISPKSVIASRDSVLQMGQGFCPERQGHLPP